MKILCGIGIVMGLLTGAVVGASWYVRRSMEVRVVNATGDPLSGFTVSVSYAGGAAPPHSEVRPALAPGESVAVRPSINDIFVTVAYVRCGRTATATFSMIDLWDGESYILTLRPDDTLEGDYDYSRR